MPAIFSIPQSLAAAGNDPAVDGTPNGDPEYPCSGRLKTLSTRKESGNEQDWIMTARANRCLLFLAREPSLVSIGCMILMLLAAFASAAEPLQAHDRRFDVLVYGGTSGGISAAVQAAKMGKHVLLVEPGPQLGGV